MSSKAPWYNILLCKILDHKFTNIELILFEVKNNPVNVVRHGRSTLTCPRCKKVFDPDGKEC